MRKNSIIISLFLALLVYAQQEELISNTWYLQKVIVDDVEHFQPFNEESENLVEASFANNMFYSVAVCNDILSDPFTYISETNFSTNGFGVTLADCSEQVNTDFESRYFSVFYNLSNIDEIFTPFSYIIVNENTYLILIVTNSENNQAIYTSVNLSIEDLENAENGFKIYPNPAQDKLYIDSKNLNEIYRITISSFNGQKIGQEEISPDQKFIDISSLTKGIYLITIFDMANNPILTQKIIKE